MGRVSPRDPVCAGSVGLLLFPHSVKSLRGFAVALAGAVALLAPRVEAASVSMGAPVWVAEGWTRAAGHYESEVATPTFQAVARCGSDAHVLYSIVHLAPVEGVVWLDLPGTPDQLVPADVPCAMPELWLEMIVDAKVVASAALPHHDAVSSVPRAALEPVVPQPPSPPKRVRLNGQKYLSAVGRRTEAGVALAVDSHLSIQLNYARTAQVPLMPYANDNGILARLRFGF